MGALTLSKYQCKTLVDKLCTEAAYVRPFLNLRYAVRQQFHKKNIDFIKPLNKDSKTQYTVHKDAIFQMSQLWLMYCGVLKDSNVDIADRLRFCKPRNAILSIIKYGRYCMNKLCPHCLARRFEKHFSTITDEQHFMAKLTRFGIKSKEDIYDFVDKVRENARTCKQHLQVDKVLCTIMPDINPVSDGINSAGDFSVTGAIVAPSNGSAYSIQDWKCHISSNVYEITEYMHGPYLYLRPCNKSNFDLKLEFFNIVNKKLKFQRVFSV